MNRRNQILAALLAAQLIIAAIVFVPRVLPSPSAAAPLFGSLKAADVTGLVIQEQNGNHVELAKKDNAWVAPNSDDYAASSDKITAFVTKLIGLQSDPLITRTASSHKRLQVADDAFVRKIDLKLADGSTHTLFLGTGSGGGTTYVRLGSQDDVYLARGLNSFEAGSDIAAWINPTYLSLPQDKLLSATIENAQGKWQFAKNAQGQWTQQGIVDVNKFDPNGVTTLLGRLSSLSMLKPLSKTDKPEYGLDRPTATVTVVVSDTASTKVYTLRIGTKDKDGNYPAISSDSQYVVAVTGANLDPFVSANQDTFLLKTTPTSNAPLLPAPVAVLPTLATNAPRALLNVQPPKARLSLIHTASNPAMVKVSTRKSGLPAANSAVRNAINFFN